MIDTLIFIAALLATIMFILGMALGGWMRDCAWREKANGPTRMFNGGRFYQVLTSEAYEDLLRSYR
jgi:hypothetical protein